MIVSFHPIIVAHRNIICAGREPGGGDLAAIRRAEAVILPQGCPEALYRMARANCARVFPNLDVRFDFPGKCGQIGLFERMGLHHPPTTCFGTLEAFDAAAWRPEFPVVVKLDWGGQGETVFRVDDGPGLDGVLAKIRAYESSGQFGFLFQPLIPAGGRALRVTVIGGRRMAYWRIQPDAGRFGTSIAHGARIDHQADPELRQAAVEAVDRFCDRSGLQLGGFDFIFDHRRVAQGRIQPLALEINYFFGRDGLGGSRGFYKMLETEVDGWLARHGLSRPAVDPESD